MDFVETRALLAALREDEDGVAAELEKLNGAELWVFSVALVRLQRSVERRRDALRT